MPTPEPPGPSLIAPMIAPTVAGVGCTLLLAELIEINMRLGRDPDGSATIGRLLGRLGGYGQLARVLAQPGMAWDASAGDARRVLRAKLLMAEPVLARLARP